MPPKQVETVSSLPAEPVGITIEYENGTQSIVYYYMQDDTLFDVYKFVSERTSVPLNKVDRFLAIRHNAIGRSEVEIPQQKGMKLKDIPVVASDELEVKFLDGVNTTAISVASSPPVINSGPIPGFIDIQVKVAGMPSMVVPVPRTAIGSMVKSIVEDRCGLTNYIIDLAKESRDGAKLEDNEPISESAKFLWGTLRIRDPVVNAEISKEDNCTTGVANIITNVGKSEFFKFNCNTTASDAKRFMEDQGLLPEAALGDDSDVMISVKGFFHEQTIDTLDPTDLLVEAGLQNGGTIFLTLACPVTIVYFTYVDATFPQMLNCSTTVDYMVPIFWGISGHNEVTPKFHFTDDLGSRKELASGSPIVAQLRGSISKVVSVDFPQYYLTESASASTSSSRSSSSSPSPSVTPSPSVRSVWDSNNERDAPAPAGAVKLGGDGGLRAQPPKSEEKMKYKHRL